jgi:F-type H+-transporting ATPase subunit O
VIISRRFFAAKKKDGNVSDKEIGQIRKKAAASDSETEKTQKEKIIKETPQPKTQEKKVEAIESVPNHKPPVSEDTIAGRYAHTLFSAASKEKNLFRVYEDMSYLKSIYEISENFRIFTNNSGLNPNQLTGIIDDLKTKAYFCKTSCLFLELLGKNKRFMYINEIAKKYIKSYLSLTKEEKITIISAQALNDQEKAEVKKALEENPENEGKIFIIDFDVNPNIVGGLQMYTENKFMDLSLQSRIDKIKDDMTKLI